MAVIIAKKITPLQWLHLIRITAFSTFSSRRRLPFDSPLIYRYPPCLIPAPNHAPRGTLIADQRRAGEARPRGKAGSERRKACFHPGGSGFLLPRGGQGHSQFYSIDFHVTNRFFVSFLTQERNVTPSSPFIPLVPAPLAAHPGQLHVQARKDALFQPGDVALRYPQRVGNLLLRHLPRAAQTKAKLHDLLLAQGQARQRRAQ